MRDSATPSIPRIEPVPEGIARPLWSVMIPTSNSGGVVAPNAGDRDGSKPRT